MKIDKIGAWTGLLGGIAGVVSLVIVLTDLWINRKPDLELFAPFAFHARYTDSGPVGLHVFVRISNSSRKDAFVYLETLAAEIKSKGNWYKAQLPITDPDKPIVVPNFTEFTVDRFGLKWARYFNRFKDNVITMEHPLSGYIAITHGDSNIMTNAEAIRLSFRDCHMHQYSLEANFEEQRERYGPK